MGEGLPGLAARADPLTAMIRRLSYEVKIATGLGEDDVTGDDLFGLSYEHQVYFKLTGNVVLRYHLAHEQGIVSYQAVGLSWQF